MNSQLKTFLVINNFHDFLHNYVHDGLSYKDKKNLVNFLATTKQKILENYIDLIVEELCFKDKEYLSIIFESNNEDISQTYRLFIKKFFHLFKFSKKEEIINFCVNFSNTKFYSDSFLTELLSYSYNEDEKIILINFFKKQEHYFCDFNKFDLEFRNKFIDKIGMIKSLLYIYKESDLNLDIISFINEKINQFNDEDKYLILNKNCFNIFYKEGKLFNINPINNSNFFIIFLYENYFEFLKSKNNFDKRILIYIEKEYFNLQLNNF